MSALPKTIRAPRDAVNQTVGASIIRPLKVRVFHERDTVVLEIDGTRLAMEYPYAIAIAGQLRMHGKQAKKFAGDFSKHWSTEASVLTDAEENARRGFK